MIPNAENEKLIRRYLLGELTDEALHAVEIRLLEDAEFAAQVQLVESELVDEYLDDTMTDEEREKFDRHFLAAPPHQHQLSVTRALRRQAEQNTGETNQSVAIKPDKKGSWQEWFQLSNWSLGWKLAFPLALLVIGWGAYRTFIYNPPINQGLIALAQAYRNQRTVEARVSALPYAPWIQTRDAGSSVTDRLARNRAERIFLDEASLHPSAANAHALGRFLLVERKFDEAIEQFEIARKATPDDAQLLSDLGAAHLEKGKAVAQSPEPGKSLLEYAKAYEHLNRATEKDSTLLEALFNRAHCLQLMYLTEDARTAWQTYLKRDSTSLWAQEARDNLQALEKQQKKTALSNDQLFQNFMTAWQSKDDEAMWQVITQKRNPYLEDRLANAYLAAMHEGNSVAAQTHLAALNRLGELLQQRVNERFTADLATYYRQANEQQRALSIKAWALRRTADEHLNKARYAEAAADYLAAQKLFRQAGNECEALLADSRLGSTYIWQANLPQSEATFLPLAARSQTSRYLWLQFQTLLSLAQLKQARSEYSQAITISSRAEQLASHLGDLNAPLEAAQQLVTAYRNLNNPEKTLRYLQKVFEAERTLALDAGHWWVLCAQAGVELNKLNLPYSALAYLSESYRLAKEELKQPLRQSRSLSFLADTYAKLGNYAQAINHFKQSLAIGQALGVAQNGAELNAYAKLRLGDFHRQIKDFPAAMNWYRESLQYYEQLGLKPFVYAAHKGILQAGYAQGDEHTVVTELPVVINLFREYREKISLESQRNSFFDREQSIYDLAVEFEYVRRKDMRRAFDYAEESRARSLNDRLQNSPVASQHNATTPPHLISTEAQSLPQIQAELPPQVQLVQYAALDQRLLIWVVTRDQAESVEVPVLLPTLTGYVKEWRALVTQTDTSSADQLRQKSQALHKLLIEPIAIKLDPQKILCLVPDKVLHDLPFQALLDGSGKYLIESFTPQYAASASTFIAATKIAHERSQSSSERLVSVGNPAADATLQVQPLPAAQHEAEEIAQLYRPLGAALTGRAATERVVTQQLPKAEIIHLATHYLPGNDLTADSRLVLASSPDRLSVASNDGSFHLTEIEQLRLPRARLVVLSACQTGAEKILGGEGAIHAARSFLAGQVPLVVASLWPVDSTATADLMINMHQARRLSNHSTAQSLRQAQLAFLHDSNTKVSQPYYWAAFNVFGGYATF